MKGGTSTAYRPASEREASLRDVSDREVSLQIALECDPERLASWFATDRVSEDDLQVSCLSIDFTGPQCQYSYRYLPERTVIASVDPDPSS